MTNYYGSRVTGTWSTVHAGSGRLYALLISHEQETAQTVTLYDSLGEHGAILARLQVSPGQSPVLLVFPESQAIPFSTGLTIQPGSCEVNAWLVGR